MPIKSAFPLKKNREKPYPARRPMKVEKSAVDNATMVLLAKYKGKLPYTSTLL